MVSYESKVLKIKYFLCNSIPFLRHFLVRACPKVEPNLFRLFCLFFAFSFSLVLIILLPLLTASQLLTASCQSVQEFSRKLHPKGQFLPSDEEGHFLSVLFTQIYKRFCIYLKLNITLLWVSLSVWFLFLHHRSSRFNLGSDSFCLTAKNQTICDVTNWKKRLHSPSSQCSSVRFME